LHEAGFRVTIASVTIFLGSMSPDTRTRRLTQPSATAPALLSGPSTLPLVSLLAQSTRPTDVLPRLHQLALQVTGGSCSLLFEHNPRNSVLQATSGYGVDELWTDPWAPSDVEGALVPEAFERRAPTFVSDVVHQMPDLSERIKAPAALLVPLIRGTERSGLLVIGFTAVPDADVLSRGVAEVPDIFLASLELFRLRQNEE